MYIINSRKKFCCFWKMWAKGWLPVVKLDLGLHLPVFLTTVCLWMEMMTGDSDIPCVFQRLPDRRLSEGIPGGTQWATHEREDHFLPGEGRLCGPLWEVLCFIAFPPWPSTHHGQDHVFLSHHHTHTQPPITFKTARHWTVCFELHCSLPGPTWGTFQALRNCGRKLGNKSSHFKTEPLNH